MFKLFSSALLFIVSIYSSAQTISNDVDFTYPITTFPQDTTELWIEDGNPKSDTVIIICQGGPSKQLTFVEKGRTSYRYIPNYSNYRIAYLHQAQTWNKAIFNFQDEFTLEMAEKEIQNSSEMLHRAVRYFKSKQKVVIVIGTSFGAYIIPNYISSRPAIADKYILIAGRIDDHPKMLEQHQKGLNGEFKEDGLTYIPADEKPDNSDYSEEEIKEYRVKQLLKAAIGKPRYSVELSDKDLSNLIYFYAVNDQNVGRLSDQELEFLKSKKVKLFETNTGHSETLYRFIDKLRDGSLQL